MYFEGTYILKRVSRLDEVQGAKNREAFRISGIFTKNLLNISDFDDGKERYRAYLDDS